MAIKSGFFNSVNGDRKYNAGSFAEYFNTFIGNGVFPNPSDNLQIIANNDMTVTVKAGTAWINGYILVNDDDYILNIEPADGVLSRIDRVVARYDTVDREIRLEVKKSTFASSPVAPTLQRDADAYELGLADITVNAGVISISQSNITDLRLNNNLCGVVHGTVEQVDTTTLFNQYQAWFNDITSGTEQDIADWQQQQYDDFMIWFQSIQDILEGDVAANLASRISSLENDFTTHKADYATQDDYGHIRLSDLPKPAWEKIADVTLTNHTSGVKIENIPPEYYMIEVIYFANSTSTTNERALHMRFNNDDGNNYFKSETTGENYIGIGDVSSRYIAPAFSRISISNVEGERKLVFGTGTRQRNDNAVFANSTIQNASWQNTSKINTIDLYPMLDMIDAGSRFVFLGVK